jgi:hypothetical protein
MIYTTKAHALGSLPHQLELHAGFLGVERAFRSVGLPLEVIELPETYKRSNSPKAASKRGYQLPRSRSLGAANPGRGTSG